MGCLGFNLLQHCFDQFVLKLGAFFEHAVQYGFHSIPFLLAL
jgi:hypothetical protein